MTRAEKRWQHIYMNGLIKQHFCQYVCPALLENQWIVCPPCFQLVFHPPHQPPSQASHRRISCKGRGEGGQGGSYCLLTRWWNRNCYFGNVNIIVNKSLYADVKIKHFTFIHYPLFAKFQTLETVALPRLIYDSACRQVDGPPAPPLSDHFCENSITNFFLDW